MLSTAACLVHTFMESRSSLYLAVMKRENDSMEVYIKKPPCINWPLLTQLQDTSVFDQNCILSYVCTFLCEWLKVQKTFQVTRHFQPLNSFTLSTFSQLTQNRGRWTRDYDS